MSERHAQGSVSAHGNPADSPPDTAGANAVPAFDVGHELLQQEIAVANGAVRRIDVEASSAFWSDDQEISHLVLAAQIVEKCPASTVKQSLFVIAKSMQEIEDRISACWFLGTCRVVAPRQV